jgi:hypothetical protein
MRVPALLRPLPQCHTPRRSDVELQPSVLDGLGLPLSLESATIALLKIQVLARRPVEIARALSRQHHTRVGSCRRGQPGLG